MDFQKIVDRVYPTWCDEGRAFFAHHVRKHKESGWAVAWWAAGSEDRFTALNTILVYCCRSVDKMEVAMLIYKYREELPELNGLLNQRVRTLLPLVWAFSDDGVSFETMCSMVEPLLLEQYK